MSENGERELPAGWTWATVGDLGSYVNGLAFSEDDWGDQGLPIIRIQNLTDLQKPFNRTLRQVGAAFVVEPGDILVSWSATLDAFIWRGERALLNQHIFKVVPGNELPSHRFLYYLLRHSIAAMKQTADLHGSTMKHINRGPFLAYPVALPPLPEQQRIVAAIEEQFTRLDAAVAALRRVRANLKRYRASVLKAACEGRLVPTEAELARAEGRGYESGEALLRRILVERRARWEADELAKLQARGGRPRDERWKAKYAEPEPPDTSGLPELPEGWVWTTVEQLSTLVQYGTSAKTNEDAAGTPVLRMGNIVDGALSLDSLKYLPNDHDEFPALLLQPGDLLFNRTNSAELVGKSAVYRGAPPSCSFASYLIRVRLAGDCLPDMLAFYLNSSHGRAWVRSVVSQQVGQANVNGTKLQALRFPLPPLAEQERIVAEVERRLSVVEALEATVEHGLRRAERLRQAILKRAFEGKLVPQDPDDEPASELLERIRAERAAVGANGRRRNAGQLAMPLAEQDG